MQSSFENLRQGDFVFNCQINGKQVSPSRDTNAVLTQLCGQEPGVLRVQACLRGTVDEPIPDSALWQSSREDIAIINGTGPAVEITVLRPGVTTIAVSVGNGREERVASFTLVEAAGLVLYGPDGCYYKVEAESWTRLQVDPDGIDDVTKALLRGGSSLFTNGPLRNPRKDDQQMPITCHVVNLACMCNDNFPGPKCT